MKKIYILTAVLALLTLSLNAQDVCKPRSKAKASNKTEFVQTKKTYQPKAKVPTMNELLSGIKGMSSVLQPVRNANGKSSGGPQRAPLKINSDEYLVGPYTTNDFDNEYSYGFPQAYGNNDQWITLTSALTANDYMSHVGDEIVGFRFALGGNSSSTFEVSDFVALQLTSGGFDTDNSYEWNLANLIGGTTNYTYGDITITTSNWYVEFSDITVYDANNNVLEHWDANSTDTYVYTFSGDDANCYNLPAGWTKSVDHIVQEGSGTDSDPYSGYINGGSATSSGSITIPGSLLTCSTSSIRIVCTSRLNGGTGTLNVNGNGTSSTLTTSLVPYEWTIQSTGSSSANYVTLNGNQWHEFYLSEPIEFTVGTDVNNILIGYTYHQYPESSSNHQYPIATNSNSTGHNHYAFMYTESSSGGGTSGTVGPIANGTATNEYLPLYGYYMDYGNQEQMIYTASQLGLNNGDQITSVTFYPTISGSYQYLNCAGTVTVHLGNTTATNFGTGNTGTKISSNDLTLVKTLTFTKNNSATSWTINFDTPFTYTGGNLVVQLTGASGGTYGHTHFLGENQSSRVSLYSYGSSGTSAATGTTQTFLPKATFGYTSGTTYEQGWVPYNFSEIGDLAVQLIFKTTVPKTPAPTITAADNGDGTYTITATSTDPTATVILTVGNEQPVTGTGSASYIIAQGNTAQTVTATATAQAPDELVSNPTTENITIPALPKTPTPTITYQVVGNNMVITATGQGTVNLSVTGGYSDSGEGSASVTIPLGLDEQTVTATATAIEPLHQMSDPATQQITIPEAGRSPMPNIIHDWNDEVCTIVAVGTGEVHMYIDGVEVNQPYIVEMGSVAHTIVVTATNQEDGLAISRTATETIQIPAITIDGSFNPLDPQPDNANAPIDMTSLMMVDRFAKVIPNENNHPRWYYYTLEEAQGQMRKSNSIPVEVKHTGSDGLGFYSLNQIDNDTVRTLKMDVRNAAIEMPLENDPGIFFYTAERSTVEDPDVADAYYYGVLQRTSDGFYVESERTAYDYGADPYPAGRPHIHLDMDTTYGQYNEYLTYVPVVWTMGFDRVLYESDHQHNSYGAPKWKTGVGDVTLSDVDVEKQINSASTTWNDNGQTSIYMMTLSATGKMPTVNTMPYEPYMFRVFVESKNGKLRNWKYIAEDTANNIPSHFEAAPGTTTGPLCVWSEYVKDSLNVTFNNALNEIYFVKTKVDERDPETGAWTVPGTMNILFAALDDMTTEGEGENERIIEDDLKIYVRFYYIVKGSADGHIPVVHGQRPRGSADDPAGYGTESPGTSPSPATGLKEVTYPGEVVSVTYYNVQGMSSDRPFDGINIVVTRYSNGTTRTAKVVK